MVIRSGPFLHDGTPMPTRYWLIGAEATLAVSRMEAAGGVRAAERAVGLDAVNEAHGRYAQERDAAIAADHVGPRPTGGVAGTRNGVKCLHAHYGWFLAEGDDPVGRWVQQQLDQQSGMPSEDAPT